MMFTCAINVAFNLLLVPRFGIVGAAQATLISYVIYALVVTFFSFKMFSFRIDYRKIFIYAGSALMMFIAVKTVSFGNSLLNIIGQIITGSVVYILLVVLFDAEIRRKVQLAMAQLRNRHA